VISLATLPFTTSHAEWLGLLVGAVSLIGIGGVVSMLICHHDGCFRRGRFRYGHYRLCHVHHPHVPSDGKITDQHIKKMGERLERIGQDPPPSEGAPDSDSHGRAPSEHPS
jgi:hypothetical protein